MASIGNSHLKTNLEHIFPSLPNTPSHNPQPLQTWSLKEQILYLQKQPSKESNAVATTHYNIHRKFEDKALPHYRFNHKEKAALQLKTPPKLFRKRPTFQTYAKLAPAFIS